MRRRAVLFALLAAPLPAVPIRPRISRAVAPMFGFPQLGFVMGSAVGTAFSGGDTVHFTVGPELARMRVDSAATWHDGQVTFEPQWSPPINGREFAAWCDFFSLWSPACRL
jgi:hypothetical protein